MIRLAGTWAADPWSRAAALIATKMSESSRERCPSTSHGEDASLLGEPELQEILEVLVVGEPRGVVVDLAEHEVAGQEQLLGRVKAASLATEDRVDRALVTPLRPSPWRVRGSPAGC